LWTEKLYKAMRQFPNGRFREVTGYSDGWEEEFGGFYGRTLQVRVQIR